MKEKLQDGRRVLYVFIVSEGYIYNGRLIFTRRNILSGSVVLNLYHQGVIVRKVLTNVFTHTDGVSIKISAVITQQI